MKLFNKLKMLGIGTCLAAIVVVIGVSSANAIDPRAMLIDYSNTKISGLEVGAIVDTYSQVWTNGSTITGVQSDSITVDIGYVSNKYCYLTANRKSYILTADIRWTNKWDDFTDEHKYFN